MSQCVICKQYRSLLLLQPGQTQQCTFCGPNADSAYFELGKVSLFLTQVGLYDHTKRAPAPGSTLGYWQAEEGLKAADVMLQQPSQQQLPPLDQRKLPARPVQAVAEDNQEELVQETSVADSSHVAEDEEGYADVEGVGSCVGAEVAVPALQLGKDRNEVGLLLVQGLARGLHACGRVCFCSVVLAEDVL